MVDFLSLSRWSPYAVGAGIGILSWLTFLFCDKPLACSTSYARTAGMLEKALGGKASEREYFRLFKPEVEWQWMLVLGVFIGSFLSAILSGDFKMETIPHMWAVSFGERWVLRYATAFSGGILLGIGSRWAGGCTSGHGISGTMQLTLSSWLAVVVFFASGIFFAGLLYGGL